MKAVGAGARVLASRGLVRMSMLLGSSAVGAMATSTAYAQQAPVSVTVSVPAGTLDAGLRTFSSQADIQLIYNSDLVAGKATGGVRGHVSVEQAVAQLLSGTGLTFRVVNGRTIQIEQPAFGAAGEHVLRSVRVEGTRDVAPYIAPVDGDGIAKLGGIRGRQDKEADGYRAKVANVGTGAQIAIEDITRSITVLTQQQLEKQDVTTVGEALSRLPGVTIRENENAPISPPSIYVRGFAVEQYQVDGGPAQSLTTLGNTSLNLDSYERVELLRGPNAGWGGAGSAGGILNLVRKRPGAVAAQSVTLDVGSYQRTNAIVDVSTPSILGSPIALRTVGSIRRDGSFVHAYENTSILLYALFDAPLGDNARLELGGQYSQLDIDGENNGALRSITGDLLPLDRSFNYTANAGSFTKSTNKELFGKFYVGLTSDWNFEFGGSYRATTSQYRIAVGTFRFRSDLTLASPGDIFLSENGPRTSAQLGISSKLTGRFDTFGLTHTIFAAVTHTRTDTAGSSRVVSPSEATINAFAGLFNPVYVDAPSDTTPGYAGTTVADTGIVIGDTLSWHNRISLSASVRRDGAYNALASLSRREGIITGLTTASPLQSGTWRPSYSATVKPFERLTLYGSYADGFVRQDSNFSRSGAAPNFSYASLPPAPYKNKEVGIKYGASKWLASVALFDLRQDGTSLPVLIDGTTLRACPASLGGSLDSPCFSVAGNTTSSRGVDVDFSGEVLPGLSVVASYNYNVAKTIATDQPLLTFAPQTTASLMLDWRPHFVSGVGMQIGARYKGRYQSTGAVSVFDPVTGTSALQSFTVEQAPYATVDLGLDYQIDKHLAVRLFVENLTDTTYFASVQPVQGNFYGRPRTVLASVKFTNVGSVPADGRSPTTGLAPFGDPAAWYAAFDAGINLPGDLHARASGTAQDTTTPIAWIFQTKRAPAFATRLGYHLGESLRAELEVQYRSAQFGSIGGATVAPFGVCGAEGSANGVPFDCAKVPGRIDTWSLMANALYDFGSRDAVLRPFVGGGVGLSRDSVNFQGKLNGIGGATPWQTSFGSEDTTRSLQEKIVSTDTTIAFTFQAIAGVSLKLADRLHVDATYRYVDVPTMKFSSYNLDEPASFGDTLPLTSRVGTFDANYHSSLVTLGVRWAFGTK